MRKKIRLALIFGGRSAEHEVSLLSAGNIFKALSKEKYELMLIGVDRDGHWFLNDESKSLLESGAQKFPRLSEKREEVALIPGKESMQLVNVTKNQTLGDIDVVFPVLHGSYGEDGSVQGLLRLANIPFVGAGVLGSAIGMDKDVTKRLLRDADIPISNFLSFTRDQKEKIDPESIKKELGMPVFVKPASLGSSVGISKVSEAKDMAPAVNLALQYDNKVLIEQYMKGREIECAVLGNESPIASVAGEIVPQHEFYSYEAKYIDEKGAILEIPAKLTESQSRLIQEYSLRAFKTLCCEGMARVDFFLTEDGQIVLNEINTIPGFTKISMYTKLWEQSGIQYAELIDRLVQLAIDRFERDKQLKTEVSISHDDTADS